ncbi:hypothetical protein FOL47_007551 [Perkinsus chesapeaki]|uniref:Uncharacterized protein n=1 Tax=Perkinsus chesapeaki TaxID=330153 RepID=A0A7J6MVE9_PERCH|nr:hypothetical protein FOL47_007551 [Perkinsus chesapeaki]
MDNPTVTSPGVQSSTSSTFTLAAAKGGLSERDLLIASFIAKHQLKADSAAPVLIDLTSHDLGVIISAFDPSLAKGTDKEALLRRFVQVYFDQKTNAFVHLWKLADRPTKDLLSKLSHKDRGLVMERFSVIGGNGVDQKEKHRLLKALVRRRMDHRIHTFADLWEFADKASAVKLLQTLTLSDLQIILAAFNPDVLPCPVGSSRYDILVRTVDIYISRKIDAFVSFWCMQEVKGQVAKVLAQLWHSKALGVVLERANLQSAGNGREKLAQLHRFIHCLVNAQTAKFSKAHGLQREPLWDMAIKTLSVKKLLMLMERYSVGLIETPSQALGRWITVVSQQQQCEHCEVTPALNLVTADVSEPAPSSGPLPSSVAELHALLASGDVVLPEEALPLAWLPMAEQLPSETRKSLEDAVRTLALAPDSEADKRGPAWDTVKSMCKAHGQAAVLVAENIILKELILHPNLRVRQRLLDHVLGKLIKSSVAARKWFLGDARILQKAAKSWGIIGERKESAQARSLRDTAVQYLSEWELHFGGRSYAAPLESLLASLRSRDQDAVPNRRQHLQLTQAAQEERLLALWKRVVETLKGAEMRDIDNCITRIDNALEILFPSSLDEVFNDVDLDAELAKEDMGSPHDAAPSSSSAWVPDRNVVIKIQPGAASLAPQEKAGENDVIFDQLRDDLRLRDAMVDVISCDRLRGRPLVSGNAHSISQDICSSPEACMTWLENKRAELDRVVGRALISTFNTTREQVNQSNGQEAEEASDDESEYNGEFDDTDGGIKRDLELCRQAFSSEEPTQSKKRRRMHLPLAFLPPSFCLTGVLGEDLMQGIMCVKNDQRLTVDVKEELMIPTQPAKKYFCSAFKLTSTPKGLQLEAPLFGVTAAQPKYVSFSGEPLDVINIDGLLINSRQIVVNLSLEGVSKREVEVMVWFDMKNQEGRDALKRIIERHIRMGGMHPINGRSVLL